MGKYIYIENQNEKKTGKTTKLANAISEFERKYEGVIPREEYEEVLRLFHGELAPGVAYLGEAIKSLEAWISENKERVKAAQERNRVLKNRIDSAKDFLKWVMKTADMKKVEGSSIRVSYSERSGEKLEIDPKARIPFYCQNATFKIDLSVIPMSELSEFLAKYETDGKKPVLKVTYDTVKERIADALDGGEFIEGVKKVPIEALRIDTFEKSLEGANENN